MVVLEGATGREKGRFALPAPADDCFLFADLTGRGRREDLVVKDRYWNMWGVAHDGKVLWHWSGSTGPLPGRRRRGRRRPGRGLRRLRPDRPRRQGALLRRTPRAPTRTPATSSARRDGKWRLLFGNAGIHCLAADGTELWQHPLGEAQHVVAGRFRKDSELQLAVVDRTPLPTHRRNANAWAILYLYDLDGKEIWRRQQQKGDWAIAPLADRVGRGSTRRRASWSTAAVRVGPR